MAKYDKKIVKRICDLIEADNYTINEICSMSGINTDTFYNWKKDKPEFYDKIAKATDKRMQFFVHEAKKSLLKKIQGYTVEEKQTIMVDSKEKDESGKAKPKIKEQRITQKHFQPDTSAIQFVLTNGDPATWKNRQNTDIVVTKEQPLFGDA